MSFDLPRNAKGLRFTGSVEALEPPPMAALGRPRHRNTPKPTPQPRAKEIVKAEIIPPPYHHGVMATPPKAISSRAKLDSSYDDEGPTMAMDREALDILPGGMPTELPLASMPPAAPLNVTRPPPAKAIPHFRSARAAQPKVIVPQIPRAQQQDATQAPLLLWVMASLVAGVLSYRLLPELVELLQTAARYIQH
jgi:hypothetical protein